MVKGIDYLQFYQLMRSVRVSGFLIGRLRKRSPLKRILIHSECPDQLRHHYETITPTEILLNIF